MNNQRDATVSHPTRGQKAFAVTIFVATVAYLLLAITGNIIPANRLTAAEFGVVVIVALAVGAVLRPDLFDRLQKVDFAGIKVELKEVKLGQMEVQKNQQEQQAVLEDVRLALRLLIGKNEQQHVMNLFKHETGNYRVRGALRDEIRRLRAMRLVRTKDNKTVAGMPDAAPFDLSEYVELTDDGLRFAARLANHSDTQTKDANATN